MYTLQMLQADSNAYDDSIIIAKSDGIRLTVNKQSLQVVALHIYTFSSYFAVNSRA